MSGATTASATGEVHRYRAFGLAIASTLPLAELSPGDADDPVDLSIELGSVGEPLPRQEDGVVARLFQEDGHFLAWPGIAAFRILGTDRIIVEPHHDAPLAYLAFPLLGPIFGLLLHLRGLLVLHASAVKIGGSGAVFVGDKMAGKSTTAAAFLRAGHRLLTDDLLAIDLSKPDTPLILPAFAQLKLSREASTAVQVPGSEELPLVFPLFEKHQHRLHRQFGHEVVPAGRVHVLQRGGTEPGWLALSGVDAMRAVMRFSYIIRFGKIALPGHAEAEHMKRCAALARAIDVGTLVIPADLDRLEETVAFVNREMGA